MRKKRQQARLLIGAAVLVFILLVAAAITIIMGKRSLDTYKDQIAAYEEEMSLNKKLVYVSTEKIKKGETISENNVTLQMVYSGVEQDYFINEENLGMQAIVDIRENEPIMSNMVSPIFFTDDLRDYEMTVAHLMTKQAENDVVDVRIMFPDGEDFVILSKKQVRDLSLEASIFSAYLTEDEILRMSSAIVDAYTTSGSKIYTTKYIEPNVQVDAIPTYPVKPAIIDLINSDPNILDVAEETLSYEARMDLDNRLQALTEEQLEAITAGLALDDTAKSSVIREGAAVLEGEEGLESENYDTVLEGDDLEEDSGNDSKTNDDSTGGELTEDDSDFEQ